MALTGEESCYPKPTPTPTLEELVDQLTRRTDALETTVNRLVKWVLNDLNDLVLNDLNDDDPQIQTQL